jgi:hypothetical protein
VAPVWRRFGVGASLRYFIITVDDKRDADSRSRFVLDYFGPVICGVFIFLRHQVGTVGYCDRTPAM